MKSKIFTIITILALVIGFGLVFVSTQKTIIEISSTGEVNEDLTSARARTIEEYQQEIKRLEESQKIYHILVGGDIMLDRGVESKILAVGGGDWTFPWKNIGEDFRNADIAFANFEGSMSNVGSDTGKKYSFRFNTEAVKGLEYAGFDVVSLANNHMLDWGRESLCETTKNLESAGVGYIGAGCNAQQANTPYIADLGDTKVAFIGYTTFYEGAHATDERAGITELDREKMKQTIRDLKASGVDVVLLSMHWGIEYDTRSSKREQDFAHELVDAGLDVLVGHHPHVAQEIERYKDGWIIYSLGNLVFDQYFSEETMQGLLADIQIQNGRVYDIQPKKIQLNADYQPEIVE